MNLSKVLLKYPKGSSVCLYVGSFDPFHNGHREVAEVMTQYADCVVIVPNNPNKSKPFRAEVEHRIEMISLSIVDLKNVYVVLDDIRTVSVKPNYQTCGVMGSDQYLNLIKMNKSPHLDLDRWFIVPREHMILDKVNKKENITLLRNDLFKEQHGSSTLIRDYIFDDEQIRLSCLHPKAMEYMLSTGLYSKKSVVEKKIRFLMAKDKIKGEMSYIKDCVINIDNQIIVKVFFNIQDFKREKLSYDVMTELIANSLKINTPRIEMIYSENKYGLIGFSFEGQTAEDKVKDSDSDSELLGSSIGKTLKILHSYKKFKFDRSKENNKLKKVRKELGQLVDNFYNNPGETSYVHGDASLSNFLISDDYKVTLIDFNGVAKYGNHER